MSNHKHVTGVTVNLIPQWKEKIFSKIKKDDQIVEAFE